MQVSNYNNIKLYNLSAGKSLPEWLSDRKKRLMQKKDTDIRRRIQLIQDFEMPGVSTSIKVSRDGQYIMATGVYKPRVRCYDVNQLSMKFERCLDSEVVRFEMLSEDYSKVVFLQSDRYVEFHASYGRYYRLRIPKFGRDMAYHMPSCDLYFVGASPEIWRLNLEQGKFLNSLQSDASSINTCSVNPVHHLFVCGTNEGKVEAWDPRCRSRVGILDCALSSIVEETEVEGMPSVTSLAFHDCLTMAVGTATGQILLYDIRSSSPILVKDHMYGLPIKDIAFHPSMNLVASLDSKVLKFWDENTGKAFTSIQPSVDLNNLCIYPNSGLLFLANEDRKILSYYIPALGPAPKWCSFLDNLTEELEESNANTVYDDYKFVTAKELEELNLTHLIGSNLLRAYMHGYFMDVRMYFKAKAATEPFNYQDYRRKKIREKIEAERTNRVKINKLPNVNKELAAKLMEMKQEKCTKKEMPNLLQDSRFRAIFENPDFQIDENDEEYKLMKPLISKLNKATKKKISGKSQIEDSGLLQQFQEIEEEDKDKSSSESDEDSEGEHNASSSDDDQSWRDEMRRQYRSARQEERIKKREEDLKATLQPRFYELKSGDDVVKPKGLVSQQKLNRVSLGQRLEQEAAGSSGTVASSSGNRTMTFTLKKSEKEKKQQEEIKLHIEERRRLSRPAKGVSGKPKRKGNFFRK